MATEPSTLQEAVIHFKDADNCLAYLSVRRWPDGVIVCPTCGSKEARFLATRCLWECKTKHARQQFSIKIGTILEDSPLGLDKWLPALWMIANDRNGISSWELHRALGVTQKTAWFMLHRARLGMQDAMSGGKLGGEVDETFIGGKARNMHNHVKARKITGRGTNGKTIVMGMLQRGGMVKTAVVADREKETLQPHVKANVAPGTSIFTDETGFLVGD